MQPPAQPNFQAPQNQQAQIQGHQGQHQMQPQALSQHQSHPHFPPLQPNNLQNQQPAPIVVPAYQSHPPVQPHQQLMQATPQYPMHMNPSTGSFPLAAQFPQQSIQMPPQQANVSATNQQQPNLMPSQSQMRGVPPAQLQQIRPQAPQQGHGGQQRPALQPMQQLPQQYGQQAFPLQASGPVRGPMHQLPFAHQPMPVQSRPQGPNQLLQQSGAALPAPPPHNSVQAQGMPHQPQTHGGRPAAPNQATLSQPFPQSGGTFGVNAQSRPIQSSSVQPSDLVHSGQRFSQSGIGEENAVGQEVGSALNNSSGKDVSNAGVDSVGVKASITGIGSGNEEHGITSEGGNNGTHKGIMSKVEDAEVDAMKKDVKEDANGNLDPSSGGIKIETSSLGERDGNVVPPMQAEYSSGKDSTLKPTEAYMGRRNDDTNLRTQENKSIHEQVTPQGPAVGEYGRFQDKGFMNSSNSVPHSDQGRHQLPPGPYGPSYHQQRPSMPSDFQSGVHPNESFEGVQRRQHYQNNSTHSQPMFSRTLKAEPTEGSLHGPDGVPMQQNQRPRHFEGRYPDPHVSGPFDRGQYGQQPLANENRVPGFDAASGLHVKGADGNPFLSGPPGRIGQRDYEDAPKQFPKPSVMGLELSSNFGNGFSSRPGDYPPHEFNYGTPSRFLPPYHAGGPFHPNDVRERPTVFNEDHRARGFSARTQPDFHGSGPGFGVDHRPPRSPGREFHSFPSRGFGGISGAPPSQSGLLDGAHGRDTRAVHEGSRSSDISSDPVGKPFPEHLRNGNMGGQDFIPNHLHRGELFGPKIGQSHLRVGDGFGTSLDPGSNYPRIGEPGYRSSYSLHGFPSDGGFYAGNNNPFDRFRKRMPTSMGWCRICRVDCETVDGLDLHSQTTEHQQRTMDMVISIKQQNAKRQKNSKDHSSFEEGSRSRIAGNKGRGKKV
ncbi:hypothetical protein AG4045_017952 [Apium graveolens]|uniref:Uncharacterized protein n=2 Tax=Apium graveolens TaxID=4045 RepID=A0A6L5BBD7_APIGR|nr:hypothetical protein AG4045_017952 [Apium graveolens]